MPQSDGPADAPMDRRRILNVDGSSGLIRVGGEKRRWADDLGHSLLTMSWVRFTAAVFVCYMTINLAFAALYTACGDCVANARRGSLTDHFFFSVQTLATIGYGQMVPNSVVANLLVAIEALVGMLFLALVASLAYARFTRPSAGVMFSAQAVVGRFADKPALMLRIANQRADEIIEASASMTLVRDEISGDGERFRRIYSLPLVRSASPVFTMSWTVAHIIDENSPLNGANQESLASSLTEILVLFTGHHEGFGQKVHARRAYAWWELMWNARYQDMISDLENGRRAMDLSRFNSVEPL